MANKSGCKYALLMDDDFEILDSEEIVINKVKENKKQQEDQLIVKKKLADKEKALKVEAEKERFPKKDTIRPETGKKNFNGERRNRNEVTEERHPIDAERKEKKPYNGDRKPYNGEKKYFDKANNKNFLPKSERKPETEVTNETKAVQSNDAVLAANTEENKDSELPEPESITLSEWKLRQGLTTVKESTTDKSEKPEMIKFRFTNSDSDRKHLNNRHFEENRERKPFSSDLKPFNKSTIVPSKVAYSLEADFPAL